MSFMPDESRILALLEEALDSKRTPEDVCADEPELLWEVRERFERCQNVEAQIEAMFPTTGSEKQAKRCLHLPTTLPVIPGMTIQVILEEPGEIQQDSLMIGHWRRRHFEASLDELIVRRAFRHLFVLMRGDGDGTNLEHGITLSPGPRTVKAPILAMQLLI